MTTAASLPTPPPHPLGSRRLRRRRLWTAGLIALCVLISGALCAPAGRAAACETALVLALDVSASVDAREYRLQQRGLAYALRDGDVVQAILDQRGIWLTVFEWSGARHLYTQLDWSLLDSPGKIEAAAAALERSTRTVSEFPTSLGYAIGHAMIRLDQAPERCRRRVIDVSGDGVTNDGFGPQSVYRTRDTRGITVNGLVIDGAEPSPLAYYRQEVLHGTGAFAEVTGSYDDYGRAMRRKLLRELAPAGLARLEERRPAADSGRGPRISGPGRP